jgi:hypothetical protein
LHAATPCCALRQAVIGDHIAKEAEEGGDDEEALWDFVSKATENHMDGHKLAAVYEKLRNTAPAAVPGEPAPPPLFFLPAASPSS